MAQFQRVVTFDESVVINMTMFPRFAVQFCASVCVCVFGSFSHVQLFATPWTVVHQAPLSVGFSRQEYWSGFPLPYPVDLPNPRIEPCMADGLYT